MIAGDCLWTESFYFLCDFAVSALYRFKERVRESACDEFICGLFACSADVIVFCCDDIVKIEDKLNGVFAEYCSFISIHF